MDSTDIKREFQMKEGPRIGKRETARKARKTAKGE
jgi:hypothetical protein